MGKILDQGTICLLCYSAVLEYGCAEQLCEQAWCELQEPWAVPASTRGHQSQLNFSLPRLVGKVSENRHHLLHVESVHPHNWQENAFLSIQTLNKEDLVA